MAPFVVNPDEVHEFKDAARRSTAGIGKNHDKARRDLDQDPQEGLGPAVGRRNVEALDVALCWGWIDAIRKGFDDKSFLQRYTPRGKKSIWSQINIGNVDAADARRAA